jgi:AbrB family looped-hinge helix DNA binding protein
MKAVVSSKGQITIPLPIRKKLHLNQGDVLEFDENSPYLKGVKAIPDQAWEQLISEWKDPWPTLTVNEVLDEWRGPVDEGRS